MRARSALRLRALARVRLLRRILRRFVSQAFAGEEFLTHSGHGTIMSRTGYIWTFLCVFTPIYVGDATWREVPPRRSTLPTVNLIAG